MPGGFAVASAGRAPMGSDGVCCSMGWQPVNSPVTTSGRSCWRRWPRSGRMRVWRRPPLRRRQCRRETSGSSRWSPFAGPVANAAIGRRPW